MFKLRNWIELDQFAVLEEKSIMIAKMLNSLINAIKSDA